jgi:hypothetical protein
MHTRFFSLAAVAALGFLLMISGVSYAQEEGSNNTPEAAAAPAPMLAPDSDPNQAASPQQHSADQVQETETPASVETVEPESVPVSEE